MKSTSRVLLLLVAAALLIAAAVVVVRNNSKTSTAAAGTPRTADGHPDFSGYWGRLKIDAPPQTEPLAADQIDGGVSGYSTYITAFEKDAQVNMRRQSNRPIYKPQYWEKIRAVDWDFSRKKDPQSHCLPGVPRLGVPNKITQVPNEIVFFYEEESNIFRVIPTDGRPHNTVKVQLPSWLGDSVGHWEGDTLVIDTIGLIDQGWIGPTGYIRSPDVKVTERLHREGNKLFLDRIVEDPMLLQPWHMDTVSAELNTNPQAALWDEVCSEHDEVFEGDPYEGR
jgi:hypothetical protein